MIVGGNAGSSSVMVSSELKFAANMMGLAGKIDAVTQGIAKINITLASPESSNSEKRSCMMKANQLYEKTANHQREIKNNTSVIENSSNRFGGGYSNVYEKFDRQARANLIDLINLRDTYEASMPADTRRFELIACVNRNDVSLVFAPETKTEDGGRVWSDRRSKWE